MAALARSLPAACGQLSQEPSTLPHRGPAHLGRTSTWPPSTLHARRGEEGPGQRLGDLRTRHRHGSPATGLSVAHSPWPVERPSTKLTDPQPESPHGRENLPFLPKKLTDVRLTTSWTPEKLPSKTARDDRGPQAFAATERRCSLRVAAPALCGVYGTYDRCATGPSVPAGRTGKEAAHINGAALGERSESRRSYAS